RSCGMRRISSGRPPAPSTDRSTWSPISSPGRCSGTFCASSAPRAATSPRARSAGRWWSSTCAPSTSSTSSCTAPPRAPAPPSGTCSATSRAARSVRCWIAPSASPSSTTRSAPSSPAPTSASSWWSRTGTGTRWARPTPGAAAPRPAARHRATPRPAPQDRMAQGCLMRRERSLELIDAQSGGDVSRVVTAGIEPLPGISVLEKARFLEREGDGLRRLLLSEPYGDPAMSVDLLVEPGHPEAQAGYIIMEAMGYPLYSGSNTLCVATVLLESGMLPMADGPQQLVLESPAGLARITAVTADGRVESVTTQGEPAYVAERGLSVDVPEYGPVGFDLVWSGAYYAMIDAAAHGFALTADEQIALSAFGDAFVRTARPGLRQEHPSLGDLGPLPFVHVMGPVEVTADGRSVSRSATYVHPG